MFCHYETVQLIRLGIICTLSPGPCVPSRATVNYRMASALSVYLARTRPRPVLPWHPATPRTRFFDHISVPAPMSGLPGRRSKETGVGHILAKEKIDINARDEVYGTALQAASAEGPKAMKRLSRCCSARASPSMHKVDTTARHFRRPRQEATNRSSRCCSARAEAAQSTSTNGTYLESEWWTITHLPRTSGQNHQVLRWSLTCLVEGHGENPHLSSLSNGRVCPFDRSIGNRLMRVQQ